MLLNAHSIVLPLFSLTIIQTSTCITDRCVKQGFKYTGHFFLTLDIF
jgi:hypothetical protein